MRNEINSIPLTSLPQCLIINMDHSNNPGTHWTSLFITHDCCIYFDSFGLKPPNEITHFLDRNRATGIQGTAIDRHCSATDRHGSDTDRHRYFNTFPIQSPDDVTCGHYSIYLLFKLSNCHEKFYNILNELYETKLN